MKGIMLLLCLLWTCSAFASGQRPPLAEAQPSVVEGTLSLVSKLPPPQNNPYPDCYYTAVLDISQIISGRSIPGKIVLVLPGFFAREYAPEAKFKAGDKVRATVAPFASMPEAVRQIQQADEVEDITLEVFFPRSISLIQAFQNVTAPVGFAGETGKARKPGVLQATDLEARAARKEAMKRDLDQINHLLATHGGDWNGWYDSLKPVREQYKKQYDRSVQRWFGDSFFSAGYSDGGKLYSPDFVKSVVEFKNYLAARNVDLILVRVPNKGEIVEDLFVSTPSDQITNPNLLRLYKELLESDVEIITDIVPKAKLERFDFPLMYWYQDFYEIHPGEGIAWVIAKEFADRVSRYRSVRSLPKRSFSLKVASRPPTGWLNLKWPAGNPNFNNAESVRFKSVVDDAGRPLGIMQGHNSPILFLGSSFLSTPGAGGTIPDYFAYHTGIVPDILLRNEGDIMMPRSIAREGDDFLTGRSVCLFPFVPGTATRALASLPIFDPEKSQKIRVLSFQGKSLKENVIFPPETPEGVFSYIGRGTLRIGPIKDRPVEGEFSFRLPAEIEKYPYFAVELSFASLDRTNVAVKYAGQTDFVKRSDSQKQMNDFFTFKTQADKMIHFDFKGAVWLKTPVTIDHISVYGVQQPQFYNKGLGGGQDAQNTLIH